MEPCGSSSDHLPGGFASTCRCRGWCAFRTASRKQVIRACPPAFWRFLKEYASRQTGQSRQGWRVKSKNLTKAATFSCAMKLKLSKELDSARRTQSDIEPGSSSRRVSQRDRRSSYSRRFSQHQVAQCLTRNTSRHALPGTLRR